MKKFVIILFAIFLSVGILSVTIIADKVRIPFQPNLKPPRCHRPIWQRRARKEVKSAVDLGAAPGSWSQYLVKKIKNGKILSIDTSWDLYISEEEII